MNKKEIGITGGTGVLGKIICKDLDSMNFNYSKFKGDICSKKEISEWVLKNNFDSIIHLAAIVSTKQVDKDLEYAYSVNVEGTENLINILNENNLNPWLFYASTSHVYKSSNTLIKEEDITNPISEYGKTKYDAEKIIQESYTNYCIGRIFSFYHQTQKKSFLYPRIKYRLDNEDLSKDFELYGANSIRDFLNAEEVSKIIIQLMQKRAKGIYNIASGKGIKIKDFVQNLTNKKLNIKSVGGSDYLVADITKLKKVLRK